MLAARGDDLWPLNHPPRQVGFIATQHVYNMAG